MKKILFTISTTVLLISPSLLASENTLQEHLDMEQKLKQKEKLKKGNHEVSNDTKRYKFKHKKKNQYQGSNPGKLNQSVNSNKKRTF